MAASAGRLAPLNAEQWKAFMLEDGRVIDESKLRQRIFKGIGGSERNATEVGNG